MWPAVVSSLIRESDGGWAEKKRIVLMERFDLSVVDIWEFGFTCKALVARMLYGETFRKDECLSIVSIAPGGV